MSANRTLKQGPECLESRRTLKQRRKASLLMMPAGARNSQSSHQQDESNLLTDAIHLPQSVHLSGHPDTPIDNVRRLLENVGGCGDTSTLISGGQPRQTLFCEMLYLNTELAEQAAERAEGTAPVQQQLFWQQTTRWIRFEQSIEGGGTRFSKPFITLLNLAAVLQVKNCLRRGLVLLDCGASTFVRLCDLLVDEWTAQGLLADEEGLQNLVKEILFAPKLHLIGGKMRKVNEANGRLRRVSFTDSLPSGPLSSLSSESTAEADGRFEDADERLLKKLPPNTEAAAILIANVCALDRPLSAFVRLNYPTMLYPECPDHPIPVRFLFVLLNSMDNYPGETVGIGRSVGALLSDEVFQRVALHCEERHTMADALDEFLSQIVAFPPGKCSTEARWSPNDETDLAVRHVGMLYANYAADDLVPASPFHAEEFGSAKRISAARQAALQNHQGQPFRTGHLFGGLVQDVRRKLPWLPSDFADFFRGRLSQSLACTLLLFFANLSNIITFGAVMERSLHHQMASIENIICGALSGIIFGLVSGQPLNILSATGPTLIFEKILFDFCTTNHWEFLPFRFYVGLWMTFYLLLLVATDASALVALITRFTEEAFATLISVVFIIQAFEKLFEISYEAPITRHPQEVLHSACHCIIQTEELLWNSTVFKNLSVGVSRCVELGGEPQGLQCYFKPDVYMFSILLTCGTFLIAYSLNRFRRSRYFSFRFRNLISDFGVLIAIVSLTLITYLIGLEVPSLKMPASIRPTMDREWLVDVTNIDNHKVALVAAFPAIFYTILIVMDQQITAVIVNRKDNKLRKGGGYHLDLLIVAFLVLICSFFGLPFYVAATVLSVMHVESLKQNVDCIVPGEPQKFIGVKEQRLTAVFAHILIGCSVFLTPLVKIVPVPVLTGIFFYMGVVSLLGQQFVQRIGLLFMPVKYQPDYAWLRSVPIKRVHTFTCIQLLSIAALLAMKYSSSTLSMMFPMMLVLTVLLRMFLLERFFTRTELKALDDELPRFLDVIRPAARQKPTAMPSRINGEELALRGTDGGDGLEKAQ